MTAYWKKADRDGWWQGGLYTYEYQAEKPDARYYLDRRAKAHISMNMAMSHWVAHRMEWLSETAFRPVPLGRFTPDDLTSAMVAAEQSVAQLSLFEAKT